MAILSQEEFDDIFGPPKQTYQGAVQRAVSGGGLLDTVKAAIDVAASAIPAAFNSGGDRRKFLQQTVKGVTEGYQPTRAMDNVAAGAIALPGQAAGAVDLVRLGVPALIEGVTSNDDKAVTSRIADAFMSRVITPDAQNLLADEQSNALQNFVSANPTATQRDISDFHKKYLDSDEFYESVLDKLPLGLKIAQKNQAFANDVVDAPRPDKMTAADETIQLLSGAGIGLPASTVSTLMRPAVRLVGERVAKSLPARVATRAIEAVTPLTLPLTPTNVGINAGVGFGINEAARGLGGQETLIDYQDFFNPDNGPDTSKLSAATGISAGVLFGLPGVTKQITEEAAAQASKAVKYVGQSAGPTLEDQSSKMTPTISSTRGLLDSNAPVKAAAQNAGADMDTVQDLDAFMSAASTSNRVETTNNALNYGILEGIDNTVPFVQLERAFNDLDDTGKDLLDKYVYATQRRSNERVYEKSLMQQIDEARARMITAQTSGNGQRMSAASKEFTELNQKYQQLQADDPSTRSLMRDWTRAETNDFIKSAEANPQIKQIGDAMRQVSGDLLNYMEKNGLIDGDTARKWRSNRDLHVKVQERPYADKGPMTRRALLFRDKLFSESADPDQPFIYNMNSRNVTGEGAVVNAPMPAIAAMKESVIDAVRNVAANNTRREVIDRLDVLPNARGTLLRPYEFDVGNGRKVSQITPAQYDKLYPKGIKGEDNYIKLFRDGNIELWEFADPQVTKSLQFAPLASVPIFNASRKIFQQMTTGVGAPWFAARAFLWDVPVAQTTKNAGRSLGLIDTFARRLFMNTSMQGPINSVLDRTFDPTAFAAAALAIPTQLGLRATKMVGDKLAGDLANNSAVFNAVAKTSPAGSDYIRKIGVTMAQAFDQSALAVMSRNMSTSMGHLNDVSKVREDYAKAGSKITGPFRAVWDGYKAVLDSVHMSTRYAFFANNYGLLKAKYGEEIPQAEIRKLVQETRNLTGDMSRQSLNPTVQKVTSVIPYSNAMIQGTRHILSSAVPSPVREGINVAGGNVIRDKDTRFWWQFLGGVGIPTIGALQALSNWEGAEDYWYNQTPKWKQMSGIPIPSPETLIEASQTGKMPEFTPDKLNVVPIAPELSMIMYPVLAAARAMGILGKVPHSTPQPFGQQVKDVMDQITSFSTPPILAGGVATTGNRLDLHGLVSGQGGLSPLRPTGSGANADMMTTDSSISQATYDVLGALFGSATQLAMQTMNVFYISHKESDDFATAANEALDTAKFEVERRMPEVDTGLWDAKQRSYAFTPESEYVYKTERSLEPIIGPDRQLSIERDSKNRNVLSEELGLAAPQQLKDQNLRGISMAVWDAMKKKGPYKEANDEYSRVRKLLTDLENSRARMPDNRYNTLRNELVKKQQEFTRSKSQVLQSLESQLVRQVGQKFQAQYGVPFNFQNLSELVRKDVSRK